MRFLIAGMALVVGACSTSAPPLAVSTAPALRTECRTASASISFDFEGASSSRCVIEGEREFGVLITPEHAPPINPSPWYAFRYTAQPGGDVTFRLRYLGGKHRYAPLRDDGTGAQAVPITVSESGDTATLTLPPGAATVSAQQIIDGEHHERALARWGQIAGTQPFALGRSHDGRAIPAIRLGRADAPGLIVLIGRQHPPEVTGAIAMEAFVDRIAAMVAADPVLAARYQFLVVPLVNPDGVARGHWRANLGGVDLNRDWGGFTQPETRAVKAWLDALPRGVRPVLMLDFHSTWRNLFYVQGDEANAAQARFLTAWLGGKEAAFPGYPFTIEPRNANPGSGTTKNWFHQTYGIPAYTYEAADDADRAGTRAAAASLAEALPAALATLEQP